MSSPKKTLQQTICSVFSSTPASGNLAATVVLDDWPEDSAMQSLAERNNLPETTFVLPERDGFRIRWFTPVRETVLAGHATLAAAFTLMEQGHCGRSDDVHFYWRDGDFHTWRRDGILWMEYGNSDRDIAALAQDEAALIRSETGLSPIDCFKEQDLVAVLPGEQDVLDFQPDPARLLNLPGRGLAITAAGGPHDYVSRFFCPRYGVLEDPVTGSSHAILARYWARKLAKGSLTARQCSPRGGVVYSQVEPGRTLIGGQATVTGFATMFL